MANMELITSVTVGSGGAASVTLPATGTIPQTYTDLKIVFSARDNSASYINNMNISINGSSSNFSARTIMLLGGGISSGTETTNLAFSTGATATANTFTNGEVYFPNYTSSNYKSYSADSMSENNNATNTGGILEAGLWSNTAAITSITFSPSSASFVEGSTFYLYGISNAAVTAKATGGTIYSDGVYNYHTFLSTGTFTPTTALTADVLVIAGGGGSQDFYGGGGGAGGIAYKANNSLTATAYTCTVGAGGAGIISAGLSNPGTNSSIAGSGFSTITANGGGGGGGGGAGGQTGGSGGGGGGYWSYNATAGSTNQGSSGGSTGYGNNGGTGVVGEAISGGGGGAGTVGANGTGTNAANNAISGNGGEGSSNWSSWAVATGTGDRGYFAGGGGGGGRSDANFTMYGLGGIGGGGNGSFGAASSLTNGTANTGGGAGGVWNISAGSGGSGIIIIRYAI